MDSTLIGRLRNTHLPPSKGLMPVYEAVVNSIESIGEANESKRLLLSDYCISVEILRENQLELYQNPGPNPERKINGFRIKDNGVGFTEENWNSFNTLDSLQKLNKGCRGVGRLLWLKAFSNVIVDSSYLQGEKNFSRHFTFNIQNEVSPTNSNFEGDETISTTVALLGFKEDFAKATYKTLDKIASGLLEHCFWYFIRNDGVPNIVVCDDGKIIDLFDLFNQYLHSSSSSETVTLKEQQFEITHVKIRVDCNRQHSLGYCAAGRLVKEESLKGKIPGLYSKLSDKDGDFSYMAYLTGDYLDDRVTNERVNFHIADKVDDLFSDREISYDDIRTMLFPRISNFLKDSLDKVVQAGQERLEEFLSGKAPKYRPILPHIPTEKLSIDPSISDKDLDMLLHREQFVVEENILKEGHDLLTENDNENQKDYASSLEKYLNKVADLKQSDLANYVMHRRVVIDLLARAIRQQDDGSFSREDVIHRLIVPMGVTSDDSRFRHQNLWLLDERLAFHNFLASDKTLSSYPTTSNMSTKEPDIATLRVFDNPLVFGDGQQQASITVIEIKRPMRNDFKAGESDEKDPVLQALGYLRRLREGASTINGRPIPNSAKIPGFVYVLADFTEHLVNCCQVHQLQKTADGLGYFGYQRDGAYNAYVQVISFDGLVASATERNRAFFDKLGLPSL